MTKNAPWSHRHARPGCVVVLFAGTLGSLSLLAALVAEVGS